MTRRAISDKDNEIIIPSLGILRNIVCGFGEDVAPLLSEKGASMVILLEERIVSNEDEISLQVRFLFLFGLRNGLMIW